MSVGIDDIITYYNNMLPQMEKYHRGVGMGRLNAIKTALKKIIIPGIKVLDVGCGTGITSKYMADCGAIVTAIDIAPELIKYAKEHSFHKNITYIAEDAYNFRSDEKFKLIVFVDVLEHILPENIFGVVHTLTKYNTCENTQIYLNIPNNNFLKYMRENYPEKLQVVDCGYSMKSLLNLFSYCGFEPIHVGIYGIDLDVQYNEYIFLKKEDLKNYYKSIKLY